ncbi:hypothetical protein HZS_2697, partial [Henneguya salminicola]
MISYTGPMKLKQDETTIYSEVEGEGDPRDRTYEPPNEGVTEPLNQLPRRSERINARRGGMLASYEKHMELLKIEEIFLFDKIKISKRDLNLSDLTDTAAGYTWRCCGNVAQSPGCEVMNNHVSRTTKELLGFTETSNWNNRTAARIVALDCEACYTDYGLELTRVSIVNWKGESIYESFVKTFSKILDYNTSGIYESSYNKNAYKTLPDVKMEISQIISKDTLIIGHSLECDLRFLRIRHGNVYDTAVRYTRHDCDYKRSLKTLIEENVGVRLDWSMHDSLFDARASLLLAYM